ncbi:MULTISPECIES: RodZ family helix-turn-helix domain-containing protein [unclassified Gilliamella]|uniref:helix-turn-helix domain-containing protein n=1 Tax=unclassified Gilliamella TaxID=2685620 RepID=UPI001309DBCF|nr:MULTISPECIES: helix-turn-helix transcriptional regulator [unclassified Gilliamella]MWP50027.1 hypothetical protein [Gilliamella sp. Lep-s35]MWP69739.1 hypothetical protein [Gilliamella sp. Lep-s5]MWP78073.1 hypothetical protein [Gilliamella sp. Lep-s21]
MDNISLGATLADLREQMGLTQDDIAKKIYVRKTVVDDIEKDQLPYAPLVFVKSYISSYAEIVGLSAEHYQPYINELSKQAKLKKDKTQTQMFIRKKQGNAIFVFILILIILCTLSVTLYYVNKDNESHFIEISHYVSPSSFGHINS